LTVAPSFDCAPAAASSASSGCAGPRPVGTEQKLCIHRILASGQMLMFFQACSILQLQTRA
jgi:hypothetical protein